MTHRDANGWTEDGLWKGEQEFPWMPGSAPEPSSTILSEGGTSSEEFCTLESLDDTTAAQRLECVAESNESIASDSNALMGGY